MKRAIVSGVCGREWEEIASVTWPAMESYAGQHGCGFRGVQLKDFGRPLSWSKLHAIAECLRECDEVLWLDADVAVVDQGKSIFDDFSPWDSHGLCWLNDQTGKGHYNCGVWLLRRSAFPMLIEAAMSDSFIHHAWWEQAAVNALADEYPPCRLPQEWNWWVGESTGSPARFRHACGLRGMQLSAVRGWLS